MSPRWVAALTLFCVVWGLLILPFRIVAIGWVPLDDALRHAAKVVSGKEWSEILVLREGIVVDPHAGWHALLGVVQRSGLSSAPALVRFEVLFLASLFFLAPIALFRRRPEVWLLALLTVTVFDAGALTRLMLGRPFIVTMVACVVLARLWPRLAEDEYPKATMVSLALLFAACTWIHGNWYLLLLPLGCFFLVGEWRVGARLSACAAVGTVAGAALTGHPLLFLRQSFLHPFYVLGTHEMRRELVGELQPHDGSPVLVLAVLGLLAWRFLRGKWSPRLFADPVLVTAAVGWGLGYAVLRFWTDLGLPALCVWMASEYESALDDHLTLGSRRRLALTAVAASVLFLAFTHDGGSRWSSNKIRKRLSAEDATLRPWLPEAGGIVYSSSMRVFFDLFYANPHADWRYILGFESGLMPPADLETYRKVLRSGSTPEAFEPWLHKLRPEDRLIIATGTSVQPAIATLEWYSPLTGLHIGRLPRSGDTADGHADEAKSAPSALGPAPQEN